MTTSTISGRRVLVYMKYKLPMANKLVLILTYLETIVKNNMVITYITIAVYSDGYDITIDYIYLDITH